jgi:hypothetical protein
MEVSNGAARELQGENSMQVSVDNCKIFFHDQLNSANGVECVRVERILFPENLNRS